MSDQRSPHAASLSGDVVAAARADDLVITKTGQDLLVYDKRSHHIHHLNHTAAVVWRFCDGRRTGQDIREDAATILGDDLSEEIVGLAVDRLLAARLLEAPPNAPISSRRAESRRSVIRKVAIKGVIALPVIASMTAPTAAMANSDETAICVKKADYEPCRVHEECCSGDCGLDVNPFTGLLQEFCIPH